MGNQKDYRGKLFPKIFCLLVCISLLDSCAPRTQEAPTASLTVIEEPTATLMPTSTATASVTPLPSATATKTSIPTPTPTPIHPVDEIILHEANDEIIWDWFSYVPANLDKSKPTIIMVAGLHGNVIGDYDKQREISLDLLNWTITWPGMNNFILLTPVIPRSSTYYTVAFPSQSLSTTDDYYSRADLKTLQMIKNLSEILKHDGYDVYPKIFIWGFSAGSGFARGFTLLHPELVQATAYGGFGCNFMLPLEYYSGTPLTWPVGIYDIEELTGIKFNEDEYKNVKQYAFLGELDTGECKQGSCGVCDGSGSSYFKSNNQITIMKQYFGYSNDVQRQINQINYLHELGFDNITFKIFPEIGHEIPDYIIYDTMSFFLNDSYPEELSPSFPIEPPSCLGDTALTCGKLILPQQLPFIIDGKAEDWVDYTPVLTDKTGDSEVGEVMDFEGLYMAQDDNYLYLMLEAGERPSGEWESWAVGFDMDLGVENPCGGTEWLLDIWTERPADRLVVDSLDECEDYLGGQGYPGEYIWEDVLEVKILLAYLKNPTKVEIFHVKGILVESEGNYITPDEMR